MQTVSLRLMDHEVAGIEAAIRQRAGRTKTDVIRKALRELMKTLGINSQEELKNKQAREWKEKYGKRPGRRGPL